MLASAVATIANATPGYFAATVPGDDVAYIFQDERHYRTFNALCREREFDAALSFFQYLESEGEAFYG